MHLLIAQFLGIGLTLDWPSWIDHAGRVIAKKNALCERKER